MKTKPFRELLEKRLTKEEIAEIEKSAQDESKEMAESKKYKKIEKIHKNKVDKENLKHEKWHDEIMEKAKKPCKKDKK